MSDTQLAERQVLAGPGRGAVFKQGSFTWVSVELLEGKLENELSRGVLISCHCHLLVKYRFFPFRRKNTVLRFINNLSDLTQ